MINTNVYLCEKHFGNAETHDIQFLGTHPNTEDTVLLAPPNFIYYHFCSLLFYLSLEVMLSFSLCIAFRKKPYTFLPPLSAVPR